jgi:hypothetical protein
MLDTSFLAPSPLWDERINACLVEVGNDVSASKLHVGKGVGQMNL